MKLLETTRKNLVKQLENAEGTGRVAKRFRKYKRKARKEFLLHQKLGRKSRSQRKKVQKKMLNYTKRNYRQLAESIDTIEKSAVESPLVPDEKKNLEKMKHTLVRAGSIINRQKRLIQGEKIGNRIVSFHHQDVRPMVGGKYPVNVEFGRKLLLVESGGTLELAASFWDNISDTRLVGTTLDYCEEVLGLQVKGLGADRGFQSGENRNLCRDRGLTRIGIQRKGPSWKEGQKTKETPMGRAFVTAALRDRRQDIGGQALLRP